MGSLEDKLDIQHKRIDDREHALFFAVLRWQQASCSMQLIHSDMLASNNMSPILIKYSDFCFHQGKEIRVTLAGDATTKSIALFWRGREVLSVVWTGLHEVERAGHTVNRIANPLRIVLEKER